MHHTRLLSFVVLVAGSFLAAPTAQADPYKWCAVYGGRDGGARNCGFVSFEQCMATVRGMGGFCQENQFYTGPEQQPSRRSRKRSDD